MDKSDATSKQGTEVTAIDRLYDNSVKLIQFARNVAVKQVNTVQLLTYYSLGRWIVEEQQEGSRRAIWAAGYKKAVGEAVRKIWQGLFRGYAEKLPEILSYL